MKSSIAQTQTGTSSFTSSFEQPHPIHLFQPPRFVDHQSTLYLCHWETVITSAPASATAPCKSFTWEIILKHCYNYSSFSKHAFSRVQPNLELLQRNLPTTERHFSLLWISSKPLICTNCSTLLPPGMVIFSL